MVVFMKLGFTRNVSKPLSSMRFAVSLWIALRGS